ncbi:DNA methyltransferase [Comamonas sp.]|uniref:DNA methyltransferase n=1 Tax=Comamonas sp. TaxID=34028 RepID=UPI00258C1061|nr:DNA methyltransferase [Comamonas sp.]
MRPLAYNPSFALNAICPYFTMFPLEYPLRVLKRHRAQKPVVMDPFCGRGTTLFAARVLGLESWGVDTSPVAVAIAKAKLSNSSAEDALCLAHVLLLTTKPVLVPKGPFFESAYHHKTLEAICALREALLEIGDSDESVMLRAAILGCLHGPLLKGGEASYFSNQMPRTYAPKPDYSVEFWKKRNLVAPEVDVLKVLERKLKLIAASRKLAESSYTHVIHGDSTACKSLPATRQHSVVVTSPPYYGMKTYVQDQWLRNWFLGGPETVDYGAGLQIEHTGQDVFASSLGKVWANMANTKAPDLHMYVRFGVIPSAKVNAKELMHKSLEASGVNFRVVSARNALSAHSGKRQAEQMRAASGACDEYDFHIVKQ